MSIKDGLLRAGGEAVLRAGTARPWLKQAAGLGLNFLLGFAMAFVRVLGSCAPFGLGMVARAGGGVAGAGCLMGAVLGYVVSGGLDWSIHYVAAAVLIYTASFVFQTLPVYDSPWFMPLITAGVAAATGILAAFEIPGSVPAAVMLLTEVVLSGASAMFFSVALSDAERPSELLETRYEVCLVIFVSCLLMALSRLVIADAMSVGRVLALLLVMTASYKGGAVFGSAAGAAFGFAMDAAGGQTPFFTMAYAFSGMLAGILSKHGRLGFVLSFMAANLAAVMWSWGTAVRLDALFECFAASMLFVALPGEALDYVGSLMRQPRLGSGDTGLRRYTAARIERMSRAFRELFDTVHNTLECGANDGDISTAFDRAADAVCVSCANKDECWHRDYIDTLTVINDASPQMLERGRLETSDLAERFLKKCPNTGALVGAVNSELRGILYRRRFHSRISENRTAAYGQYLDVARILDGVSKDLGADCSADPLAERRLLRYLGGVDIDARVSVFRDSRGRLRAGIESAKCAKLISSPKYLDELSAVLGVRLCCDKDQDPSQGRLELMEAEPLAVSVGIASMKKQGESVSGDRGTYFKTDEGVLCVILSDGMGSGPEAARDSIDTVHILESFLRSGVAPETAMKMLNSVVLLRSADYWGYATVDLMCVDLFTGETSFYKYGAAPSYVWSGKGVRRVRGESLAPGFGLGEAGEPDVVRLRLRAGSRALIISDGVLGDGDDRWLRELLSRENVPDARTLSRQAIQSAVKDHGSTDDMTVLVVYVQERA
ncbi:MAG: SpoIIE family protein phosphatase [Candidatus Heteroscillospira sp.]|jgi:stage II sporulation protein E